MVRVIHNKEGTAHICILRCHSGPWAQTAQHAALRGAAGQCLGLFKEQRARLSPVSSVPSPVAQITQTWASENWPRMCGSLKTHLYISWEMSLPNGESALGNPDMVSESETLSE